MVDTVRWQPKANYIGDKPMFMNTKGGWVAYQDFRTVFEENQRMTAELIKLYQELAALKEAAHGA